MVTEKIRAFFAISIPEDISRQLIMVVEQLKPVARDIAWIRPEKMHITLRFLGNIAPDYAGMVVDAKKAVADLAPFSVQLDSLILFPAPHKPRILAVKPASYVELLRVNLAIEKELTAYDVKREKHGFVPHVTLGRLGDEFYLPPLNIVLPKLEFEVSEIILLESLDGSYKSLATIPL